jgi:hypothetical protein
LNPLVKDLLSATFQPEYAGPKKSRNHRSVSQAGRDQTLRLLMDNSLLFVVS